MANRLLTSTLTLAVPLEMARLADLTPEQRRADVTSAGRAIGTYGDVLLYGGGRGIPSVFATVAKALAVLAYQPGGVTFDGVHFCADHQACRDADAEADARLADEPGAGNTEVA